MKTKIFTFFSLCIILLTSSQIEAQTTYTWNLSGTGNWGTPSNWSPNGIPKAGDSVVLTQPGSSDVSITIDTNRTIRGLSFTSTNKNVTVNISSGITLTVTRNITFNTVSANGTQLLNVGAGAIICDSIKMVSQGNTNRVNAITLTSGNLTCNHIVMASCPNCDASNTITMTGAGTFAVSGSVTGGTQPAGNDGTIGLGTLGTLTFNGSGGTQIIPPSTYCNVLIAGSGTKQLGGNITINPYCKLKWAGSSVIDNNGFSLTYSANSYLVYEDVSNGYKFTTGNEWPTTNAPPKVTINLVWEFKPKSYNQC